MSCLRLSCFGFLVACMALPAACSDDTDVGSMYVKSVDVIAAEGATIDVSAAESAELAGTRLVITPDALAQDTTITLRLYRDDIIAAPDVATGSVAEWGPANTTFSHDVALTLPFQLGQDDAVEGLYLAVSEQNGEQFQLYPGTVDADSELASTIITGFTRFQHGVRGCPSANHPCPSGTVCERGKCVAEPPCTNCNFETNCADEVDNDGDGAVDCDDSDCAGGSVCAAPTTCCVINDPATGRYCDDVCPTGQSCQCSPTFCGPGGICGNYP